VLLLSAKLVGLPIKAVSALAPPALLLLQPQQHATYDNNFCEYNSSLPQQIFWIRITPKKAFQQSKTPKSFVALKSRCGSDVEALSHRNANTELTLTQNLLA
jgi:hypothetical protein